jgi:phenolic acid decarboxylase
MSLFLDGDHPRANGHAMDQARDLTGLIGKHLVYIYDNGWQYEIYVKNANTFSYRIHSGIVGGRWVTDQEAHIVNVADDVYKIAWDEPTGTTVSIVVNLVRRKIYGTIFFPRWIADDPTKTICYQNQHLDRMRDYRDQGPTYPKLVVDEAATITFLEDCGAERTDVIDRPPAELPVGYTSRSS